MALVYSLEISMRSSFNMRKSVVLIEVREICKPFGNASLSALLMTWVFAVVLSHDVEANAKTLWSWNVWTDSWQMRNDVICSPIIMFFTSLFTGLIMGQSSSLLAILLMSTTTIALSNFNLCGCRMSSVKKWLKRCG